MEKPEIYTTIKLLEGSEISILLARGSHYSRAMNQYSKQQEFDGTLFLMQELCIVDGQKMHLDYFKNLSCDNYLKIMEALGTMATIIR